MEDNGQLREVEKIIGVKFRKPQLLQEALTHRSYLNEVDSRGLKHNERLEFFGDAVLGCVVCEYLYKETNLPEGEMTNLKSALVNTGILHRVGEDLRIAPYILMSKGEKVRLDTGETEDRKYIIANVVEAIIGAIAVDRGLGNAQLFVREFILPRIWGIIRTKSYIDPKTHFQELAQEKLHVTPEYRVISESGPDHAKIFTVAVYLGGRQIAQAEDKSIQKAEVATAKLALKEEFRVTLNNDD